jgi:hypothetical protein
VVLQANVNKLATCGVVRTELLAGKTVHAWQLECLSAAVVHGNLACADCARVDYMHADFGRGCIVRSGALAYVWTGCLALARGTGLCD